MKILCIADQKDHLIYSRNIRTRFKDIDLVLSAGDLSINYYDFIVSSLDKPLLFVFGNHKLKHLGKYRKKYSTKFYNKVTYNKDEFISCGGTYIGGKVVKRKGLLIAGLGGCMRYNDGPNQFSEFEMFVYSLKLFPMLIWNKIRYGRFLDILLTHAPPYGINDEDDRCHRGFKYFLWFLKIFKPTYLLHGHIHYYDLNVNRKKKYLQTNIINVFKHFILEI